MAWVKQHRDLVVAFWLSFPFAAAGVGWPLNGDPGKAEWDRLRRLAVHRPGWRCGWLLAREPPSTRGVQQYEAREHERLEYASP